MEGGGGHGLNGTQGSLLGTENGPYLDLNGVYTIVHAYKTLSSYKFKICVLYCKYYLKIVFKRESRGFLLQVL